MLVSIAAYCLVLGAIAASTVVASKGKTEARRRNISANAQVQLFSILITAVFYAEFAIMWLPFCLHPQRPPLTLFWCGYCL